MVIPTTNLNNTIIAAKQSNAEDRPDPTARYTAKSSGTFRCFSNFTGIFQRINLGVWGGVPTAVRLQIYPLGRD